jgi:phosphopantothenoylcysteine decarboxylase/phosphopantothenate--cysteine ligase
MGQDIERRRVVLGVTGSIAAYKAAELARILVSRGYQVRAVMTASAQEFVSATTLEAVTGQPVATDFWGAEDSDGIEHISLADWADVVVVAPATADCLAKMTIGVADTPLLAVLLATRAPVLVAPAMNVNMLEHPATQQNIGTLRDRGVGIVEPEVGALACGWNGAGRLADPWEVFYQIERALSVNDFAGRHILISTGPTREAIDPVRFISNRSSGKMGVALAREAYRRGARVTLVHGPVEVKVPNDVKCLPVVSALEMQDTITGVAFDSVNAPDVVIMAAAVADFKPAKVSDEKMKKADGIKPIELVAIPDILTELGSKRGDTQNPFLVGFAVETGEIDELLEEVRSKIDRKKVDLIIGNMADDAFDKETNRVWIVGKEGRTDEILTTYKSRVAIKIFDAVRKQL